MKYYAVYEKDTHEFIMCMNELQVAYTQILYDDCDMYDFVEITEQQVDAYNEFVKLRDALKA